jgi:AcrR family transcriptional regulator
LNTDETPERIKRAARRLFAQRGIDGVSVRDIVSAAGQKNNGSLHYYFGSKDALVQELVREGAILIENRRKALLDALEAAGGPRNIREIIEILVWPSTNLEKEEGEDTYIRFITMLQMGHRDLFMAALEKRWNSSYQRCLAHIRRLLAHIPEPILNQRLVFLTIGLNAIMSARETSLDGERARRHHFWNSPSALENLIDTLQAALDQPPSPTTRELARAEAEASATRAPTKRKIDAVSIDGRKSTTPLAKVAPPKPSAPPGRIRRSAGRESSKN